MHYGKRLKIDPGGLIARRTEWQGAQRATWHGRLSHPAAGTRRDITAGRNAPPLSCLRW
jgi:hypothetical protein